MSNWSLSKLLEGLHDEIQSKLETSRKTLGHPSTKGDASEKIWLELFDKYLPKRYQAMKAHVVDSGGAFSQQMDVVIVDRQYSPFIFNFQGETVVPAESVYAVFEAKQTINADLVDYAQGKIESVRKLQRTSLPIPHAGGTYPAKPLIPIFGGILAFESDWNPGLGESLKKALEKGDNMRQINGGCIAAHGYFSLEKSGYQLISGGKPATSFLFKLISDLQFSGTVPMIDILAYSNWLTAGTV